MNIKSSLKALYEKPKIMNQDVEKTEAHADISIGREGRGWINFEEYTPKWDNDGLKIRRDLVYLIIIITTFFYSNKIVQDTTPFGFVLLITMSIFYILLISLRKLNDYVRLFIFITSAMINFGLISILLFAFELPTNKIIWFIPLALLLMTILGIPPEEFGQKD